jgi:hypothetical protein
MTAMTLSTYTRGEWDVAANHGGWQFAASRDKSIVIRSLEPTIDLFSKAQLAGF